MGIRTSLGYKEMAQKRIEVIKNRIRELAKTARAMSKSKTENRLKSRGGI